MNSITKKIEELSSSEIEQLAKEGKRQYSKMYREKNKESIEATRKRSLARRALKGTGRQLSDLTDVEIAELAHSEKKKYDREYRKKNKDKMNSYNRKYREKNKDKLKENQLRSLARRALKNRGGSTESDESNFNVSVSNVVEANGKGDQHIIKFEVAIDFKKDASVDEIANYVAKRFADEIRKQKEEEKR